MSSLLRKKAIVSTHALVGYFLLNLKWQEYTQFKDPPWYYHDVRILVARASIQESTYSYNMQLVYQKKISICLNRGRDESMDDYYTLRAEATSIFAVYS